MSLTVLWTITGAVVSVLIGLGSNFATSGTLPKEFWFARSCFWFSAIMLTATIIWWSLKTDSSVATRIIVGCILGAALFTLFPESIRWVNARQASASKGRPMMEPTLVIDSVNGNEVYYHFSIKNTGALTAYSIRISEKTGNLIAFQDEAAPYSQLMSGGTMTEQKPAPVVVDQIAFTSDLEIRYRDSSTANGSEFQSNYQFWISTNLLKPGNYAYTGANHDKTALEQPVNIREVIEKQLSQPVDSIYLTLPEKNPDGTPNSFSVGNDHRRWTFDVQQRLVIFETRVASGRIVRLTKPLLPTENGKHLVAIVWGPAGVTLTVDKQKAEDLLP